MKAALLLVFLVAVARTSPVTVPGTSGGVFLHHGGRHGGIHGATARRMILGLNSWYRGKMLWAAMIYRSKCSRITGTRTIWQCAPARDYGYGAGGRGYGGYRRGFGIYREGKRVHDVGGNMSVIRAEAWYIKKVVAINAKYRVKCQHILDTFGGRGCFLPGRFGYAHRHGAYYGGRRHH